MENPKRQTAETSDFTKKLKLIIPVGKVKNKEEVKESLRKIMASYKEEIHFDETVGEVKINKTD